MVTAIVIPVLILYFYWITRKEAAKQKERWKNLHNIPLESRVEGKVMNLRTEKKRFYHQLFTLDTTMRIQSHDRIITAFYKQQYTDSSFPPSLTQGDEIRLNGRWENELFHAGEIISIKN
ncbi:hypothetical protein [Bacillus sp. LL01]|uniref:hypothetical protein n=1 Tax=Bacillus sp. LL01 TaxID=1665556 RepID=UPI00069D3973|nr:hypothetical protein [Bacillus sp. LL01]